MTAILVWDAARWVAMDAIQTYRRERVPNLLAAGPEHPPPYTGPSEEKCKALLEDLFAARDAVGADFARTTPDTFPLAMAYTHSNGSCRTCGESVVGHKRTCSGD